MKNLSMTSGVFFVVFVLSLVSAQNELKLSPQSDMESMEEIQELLRKVKFLFEMKISSKVREGTIRYDEGDAENDVAVDPNGCSCSGLECSCCRHIHTRGFSENCCLRVTYVPGHKEIQASLILGSNLLFSKEVPAETQPPPICVAVPRHSKRSSMCIEFRNFKLRGNSFSGCSTFKAVASGRTSLAVDLGCFQMEVPNMSVKWNFRFSKPQ